VGGEELTGRAAGRSGDRDIVSADSHRLEDFAHVVTIPTRWNDNDAYGHVNNVEYISFYDTAINTWLIEAGGLDIVGGPVIAVCAESRCRYLRAITFPGTVHVGVGVSRLGARSVVYELGLFDAADGELSATGSFAHVFVDRLARAPVAIPPRLRDALSRLALAGATVTP